MMRTNRWLPPTRPWWVAIWLVTAVLGSGWLWFSRQDSPPAISADQLPIAPTAGSQAPDFTLTTLAGDTLTLSELRGTPVVLNFWASWCGPCRYETPYFQQIHETNGDEVLILGINQREGAETVAAFGDEFSLTYPLLLDSDGQVSTAYRVFGLPTTVLVDANGVVR
ncbi:MAG: TlpA family protein disulfide reductase, partial [Anaerolineales bacterium]|nr:TlpA family protein disulfide reductase [Anaerolineales bacterium]